MMFVTLATWDGSIRSRDDIRSLHRLISELLPDISLLCRDGEAQHLEMRSLRVFPDFRLMLKILAADWADIAPGGETLVVLNFTSEKVWLFAHGTMGCQQMIVSSES